MNTSHLVAVLYDGKKRKTGEPAVTHLYAVRDILSAHGINDQTILDAALLHDVLEDTSLSEDYLELRFGAKVISIIRILSKNAQFHTPFVKMKSTLDEIESVLRIHPEALVIKMADRLHNLRTLHGFDQEKQHEYLEETHTLLLPLFQRIVESNHLGSLHETSVALLKELAEELQLQEQKLSPALHDH